MPPAAPTSSFHSLLEERFAGLAGELDTLFAAAAEAARGAAFEELSQHLNQAVRRLRRAAGFPEVAATLVEAAAPFARAVAVFSVAGGRIRGERARGIPSEPAFAGFDIAVSGAAALEAVIGSGDPAVALSTSGEISPELVERFSHAPGERVYICPIAAREKSLGLLYGAAVSRLAPFELLAQTAGAALEKAEALAAPAGLVAIATAPSPKPGPAAARPGQEALDWRARRFARVRVAEIRLRQPDQVKTGRVRGRLYEALQEPIDQARDAYRRQFLGNTAAGADYLHQELVHTLAYDDARLLGAQYPGPLA